MSAGACVIASNTAPVTEVIRDGFNGVLVDFFAVQDLAERVVDVLANPDRYDDVRRNARATIVDNYDLSKVCLPKWIASLNEQATLPPAA